VILCLYKDLLLLALLLLYKALEETVPTCWYLAVGMVVRAAGDELGSKL
jgi:hypothetical protein